MCASGAGLGLYELSAPEQLLENVESCGWLYTEAEALTNHQAQHWVLWGAAERLPRLCSQPHLVLASSGASGHSYNLSHLDPHDLFYFNNPSEKSWALRQ